MCLLDSPRKIGTSFDSFPFVSTPLTTVLWVSLGVKMEDGNALAHGRTPVV